MNVVLAFWEQLGQTQAAALPPLALMQVWLRLGWGLVLAALLVVGVSWLLAARMLSTRLLVLRVLALGGMGWCLLPGEWSAAYWLGLAFQAPSLSAAALAVLVLLRHGLAGQARVFVAAEVLQQAKRWVLVAVLLGWVLLLDTFAFWPLALYPLGFGVLVWVVLLAAALLPWAWTGGPLRQHAGAVLWSVVLLVFAALRLPSGNVWDALLDPWLWGLCHMLLLVDIFERYKKRSSQRRLYAG
jgi:hypothetical protein